MRRLLLIGLIFSLFFFSSLAEARQTIGILPFKDNTGYDGDWDIQKGMAIWLGETISQNPFYQVVPVDTLTKSIGQIQQKPEKKQSGLLGFLFSRKRKAAAQRQRARKIREIARQKGVDVLITGEINEFSLSRFQAGLPLLAGYESYSSTVELQATLQRVIDGKSLGIITGRGEVRDRNLGIKLFGKPTEKELEFYGLDTLSFGSGRFKQTVLGRAVEKAINQLKDKLEQIIVPPPLPKVSRPTVLLVEENSVYVNIGIEDSVQIGDKFTVYTQGKELRDPVTGVVLGHIERKVGVIRITNVQAAHLSQAEIVEGKGSIKSGDIIKRK